MTAYLRPATLAEAVTARREHPDYVVLAGGTDLLVGAARRPPPPGILDVLGLAEATGIRHDEDGTLVIGGMTTYLALLESEVIAAELPMLRACAREIGALQIQARGTVAGNIATSSPVGDTLPVWLALDATVELVSASGSRRVPYGELITGYRKTQLGADELITAVRVPPREPGWAQHWRKVGTRRAQSISKVMLAAAAHVTGGVIRDVRLAFGAVADRPVRARAAEAAICGQAVGAGAVAAVRAALAGDITPIDDVRSSADYRLRVAQNLAARFIAQL
ncbi:MAG TPA: xanthine dehydrogenase family protein subunit M [Kofleriaceae bacterium]|nr:xanthine dehydrogenase family protein subunit M [Kofleriaceae bacterium]